MRQIAVFLSIILTAAAIAPAHSSDDDSRCRGYGFLMLEDPVNPRNIGMGSAGAALGGAGFRYYNPVGPFFSAPDRGSYVTAEFGRLPGGVNRGGFEYAPVFRDWFSAVSLHSSSVEFETRDERGFGFAASSVSASGSMSVGYIRNGMSAGIGLTMAEDRVWVESNYTAFALSAGLGCKLLDGKLNLGAAGFHGVAWSAGFGGDASAWQKDRVPRFARGGAAWADTLKSFPYTVAADVVYRDEDGTFSFPVGLEVKVLPVVDLRMGKRIGWETEILSLGLGLNMGRISFDAAFAPCVFVDDYDIKWNMSFTYGLGGSGKGKKPSKKLHIDEELRIEGAGERIDVDIGVDVDVVDGSEESEALPDKFMGDRVDEDGNITGVDGDVRESEGVEVDNAGDVD